MKKYLYVVGAFYSLVTFMIGFNHCVDHGLEVFNIGFMAMTPIISFLLTFMFLRDLSKQEEKEFVVK